MIGARVPRPEAKRFVAGNGRYTDDIAIGGAGHVVFLRSPYGHAKIVSIDVNAAKAGAGVIAVITADDLESVCAPWRTKLAMLPTHLSPEQRPLARGEVTWQGEPVVAVVARSRAEAEDALELIEIEWEELPAIGSIDAAAADASIVNSGLSGNIGLDHTFKAGDAAAGFADASVVVEHEFHFGRQTGVTLEPRSIIADFDPRTRKLVIQHSNQVPNQMRDIFAAQFGLPLNAVQVITPDVGGAFGMKMPAYPDEMAVAAIAILLGRTVRFTADRLESFVSDVHAREARVKGRLGVDGDGRLVAMDVAVLSGMGAYSSYPRGSLGEGLQAVHMSAAPYQLANFSGTLRSYFQNKVPSGVLRAVGQPLATTVTEQVIDLAARKLGIDPAEMRMRNYVSSREKVTRNVAGAVLSEMSLDRCHEQLLTLMDYEGLRQEQAALRQRGIYRGIGLAAFVEQTGVGPGLYGPQQVRVSAHEACRLSLEADGGIRCATSITDQGQGTMTALRQIVGNALGVGLTDVEIVCGDTTASPFGGGAWASRGAALGGEAALRAAAKLKESILTIAASMLQSQPGDLRLEGGHVVNAKGMVQMSIADVATKAHYQAHALPLEQLPALEFTETYAPHDVPYFTSNGVQATYVEVDTGLGTIRVLGFWVVDDCGTVINPLLVDEQIRGGVVQGIGSALYEHCIYNDDAQLENGTLADYLVPMASEMPDIHVAHVETPISATTLGARGVGEAGAVAASAAIWTAVNDALSPLGATVTQQPITPEHVLDSIDAAVSMNG